MLKDLLNKAMNESEENTYQRNKKLKDYSEVWRYWPCVDFMVSFYHVTEERIKEENLGEDTPLGYFAYIHNYGNYDHYREFKITKEDFDKLCSLNDNAKKTNGHEIFLEALEIVSKYPIHEDTLFRSDKKVLDLLLRK